MKNSWQLAVVDYSRAIDAFNGAPAAASQLKAAQKESQYNKLFAKDGDVVFICSIDRIPFSSLGHVYDAFEDVRQLNISTMGVPFSTIWMPSKNVYGTIPMFLLKPIVCEKDIIYAETELGAKLEDYI